MSQTHRPVQADPNAAGVRGVALHDRRERGYVIATGKPVEVISSATLKWLRTALKPLEAAEFRIEYESSAGKSVEAIPGSGSVEVQSFPLDVPEGSRIRLFGDPSQAAIEPDCRRRDRGDPRSHGTRGARGTASRRVGRDWESLGAFFEISTDLLRFGNVRNALTGLVKRCYVPPARTARSPVCGFRRAPRINLFQPGLPCRAGLDGSGHD